MFGRYGVRQFLVSETLFPSVSDTNNVLQGHYKIMTTEKNAMGILSQNDPRGASRSERSNAY
jgi:hypothetical protein